MSHIIEYREAVHDDIDALVDIEERCFDSDRLSRRQFRWMIVKAHAELVVATLSGSDAIVGYIIILFHRSTALARLYSIAVLPEYRQFGVARTLIAQGEETALKHDRYYMRLEVRTDNEAAIRLYARLGYHQFGMYDDYYEDHAPALRFEKRLLQEPRSPHRVVAHYAQTSGFTCGPAALMMAMNALDPAFEMSRKLEFQLWREATTIFMTSGHGGCSGHGLAMAAWRRGFGVELYVNTHDVPFEHSVRDENKRTVLRLVHEDFLDQMQSTDIALHVRDWDVADLRDVLEDGGLVLVLISSYRLNSTKTPHWVLLVAMDDNLAYLHDPEVDWDSHKSAFDCTYVPVLISDFKRMTRWGKNALRMAIAIS